MVVKAYIDAAYGVHQDSGKSHTGCAVVLGEAGPTFAKSAKQKIVTKSSTEAELVGLRHDLGRRAVHVALQLVQLAHAERCGRAMVVEQALYAEP